MDPYRTLGVPRNCTREEAKEAFLAMVSSAHPDHGGEDLAFIRLCAAYERVLAEFDRRPGINPPTKSGKGAAKPTDPARARDAYLAWLQRSPRDSIRRAPNWPAKMPRFANNMLLYIYVWVLLAVALVWSLGLIGLENRFLRME